MQFLVIKNTVLGQKYGDRIVKPILEDHFLCLFTDVETSYWYSI